MITIMTFWHYCDYQAIKNYSEIIVTIGFLLLLLFFSADLDGIGIDITAKDTNKSKRILKIVSI